MSCEADVRRLKNRIINLEHKVEMLEKILTAVEVESIVSLYREWKKGRLPPVAGELKGNEEGDT